MEEINFYVTFSGITRKITIYRNNFIYFVEVLMTMFYLTGANSKYNSHSQCLARVMVINDAHVYLTCVFF